MKYQNYGLKNLKSLDPSKHSQIEWILTSNSEKLTNSAVADIMKSLNESKSKQDMKIDDQYSDSSESDSDDLSVNSLIDKKDGKNLVENVKENIDKILQKNSIKKKTLKKRWWTPEEVY